MISFGDKMREWVNSNYGLKTERNKRIIEQELKKSTKDLVNSTPIGQIRFGILPYEKLKVKIAWSIKKNPSTALMCAEIFQIAKEQHLFIYQNYETPELTPIRVKDDQRLIFYANNIESNPNCAKDLATYWFEHFVLSAFERSIKFACADGKFSDSYYEPFTFLSILCALEFYGSLPLDANSIFGELCKKHDIKLKDCNTETGIIKLKL